MTFLMDKLIQNTNFYKIAKYSKYKVRASFDEFAGRMLVIFSGIKKGRQKDKEAIIYAQDNLENLKDKKRFSQIQIDSEIPLKHPILKYANLDSLEKIYNYVYKNGEDFKIGEGK